MSPLARSSDRINRRQADNFFPALRFAEQEGRPLNLHVTLNFDHTDCEPWRVSAAFKKLRDNHFTRWLRYRAQQHPQYGPPTYVWVVENHGGDTHVHWAVHVPRPLQCEFRVKVSQWLARVVGVVNCNVSAVFVQPIDGREALENT